jgi:hypothetical protein
MFLSLRRHAALIIFLSAGCVALGALAAVRFSIKTSEGY